VTYQNGEANGRWEGRERFPFDVIRQDGFENILTRLVSPGFALPSSLCGTSFLRHTESLHAKNANISADVRDVFVDSFANTVFDATLGFERLQPLVLSLFGYSAKPKDAFFVRDRSGAHEGKDARAS
jgi:hypothetical protein